MYGRYRAASIHEWEFSIMSDKRTFFACIQIVLLCVICVHIKLLLYEIHPHVVYH